MTVLKPEDGDIVIQVAELAGKYGLQVMGDDESVRAFRPGSVDDPMLRFPNWADALDYFQRLFAESEYPIHSSGSLP